MTAAQATTAIDTNEAVNKTPTPDDKIICQIDGAECHAIQLYLRDAHPDVTIEAYKAKYPHAPLLSPWAIYMQEQNAKKKAQSNAAAPAAANNQPVLRAAFVDQMPFSMTESKAAFHEVLELGSAPAAMSAKGTPISITVMTDHNENDKIYLPKIEPEYVFNIDLAKKVVMGLQLGMNVYLHGFHGTGKTTILEQIHARTGRPFVRVQHTLNMQESDVLGTYVAKNGETPFQLGPLPMAMLNGWTYCADEYDYAMPAVTALYQPVLEGKALLIKEAPPEFRVITPHKNFRFVATGNTNGSGDETGLYQGTLLGNAANYSRFHITEEVQYMESSLEVAILVGRTGIDKRDATKIVKFANNVREAYMESKISMTISPRELISAARLGIAFGGKWGTGLELAFANRCTRTDKIAIKEMIGRIFPATAE